ncbi:MAG: amino acid ABC transporter permease, partial [Pseudomonadota bacterium]
MSTRRAVYEARQRRRATLIAGGSTVVVLALLVLLVPLAPGWENVRTSFFNGEVFVRTFPDLLSAFLINIAIFAWSVPLIAALGLAIALARGAQAPLLFPLRIFGAIYVDLFRG